MSVTHRPVSGHDYSNFISKKKSFRVVNSQIDNQPAEEEDDKDDKPKPYTAIGAAVGSAERFRRRMNYGRVKKKEPRKGKPKKESGNDKNYPEKKLTEQEESRRSESKPEKTLEERHKKDECHSNQELIQDERTQPILESKSASVKTRNESPCVSAELRKKYPHWYDKKRPTSVNRRTSSSASPCRSPSHIPNKKEIDTKGRQSSSYRRNSFNGHYSFSTEKDLPDNPLSSGNDGRIRSDSSEKYSRYHQEEQKEKGRQHLQLTPGQKYSRRKSYDASSSRRRTPLPNLRNIRSSGYARVERREQPWSGGTDTSFVVLPSVQN